MTEIRINILKKIFNWFFHKERDFEFRYLGMKLGLIEPEEINMWMEQKAILESQLKNPQTEDLSIL